MSREDIVIPEGESTCPLHKEVVTCLRELKNNKRFWNRILESKWFFWSLTGLIGGFIAFNIWIVTEIYAQKASEGNQKIISESINQKLSEIKEDSKRIKDELKASEEAKAKERMEMMKILIDIQKQIKK